jgi:hypothetical protein
VTVTERTRDAPSSGSDHRAPPGSPLRAPQAWQGRGATWKSCTAASLSAPRQAAGRATAIAFTSQADALVLVDDDDAVGRLLGDGVHRTRRQTRRVLAVVTRHGDEEAGDQGGATAVEHDDVSVVGPRRGVVLRLAVDRARVAAGAPLQIDGPTDLCA